MSVSHRRGLHATEGARIAAVSDSSVVSSRRARSPAVAAPAAGRARPAAVGGSGTEVLFSAGDESPTDDERAGVLPPHVRFVEGMRGFEGVVQFGRRALIGNAVYTYPFIIDWGTASTLELLRALFVRQINLDLCFTAASLLDPGREKALATGASLELETRLWLVLAHAMLPCVHLGRDRSPGVIHRR